MKSILKSLLFVALCAASMSGIIKAENQLFCMRSPVPDFQIKELDCYTDFDIKTRDGYQCFIKFGASEDIKRELLKEQPEEWTQLEMGKTALATYENKQRQPQILVFKNVGTGPGKINVRVLADEGRVHSVKDIASAIGVTTPIIFENNLESFNNMRKALGTPAENCPSPYSVMVE